MTNYVSSATRYVAGNLGPVTEEVTATDLEVIGTLPAQLDGRFLKNGPNPIGEVDPASYEWFTGEGMVHGVRLRNGSAEWYRNRWVRAGGASAKLGEPEIPHALGPDRPTWSASTSVIGHAGRTFALIEAGFAPVELTDTLDTIGPIDFDGTLPLGFSAHPKMDPVTGELHVVAYSWTLGNHLQYIVLSPEGKVTTVQNVPLLGAGSPMVHDISITESRVVLFDLPCTFNLDAAMNGSLLPYRWDPNHGARLGVMPLGGGPVTWVELPELCWVFHAMNAYDLPDGRIVLDVIVHPRLFDRDVRGPGEGLPNYQRWIVDPAAGKVSTELRDDRCQEFPKVDERLVGREARYGYCNNGDWYGGLIRHDLVTGERVTYDHGPGRATQETVFIPSSDGASETDGWLMSMVHDENTQRGEVVVLDASDLEAPPVARVLLPARVPYGFHNNWIPTGQ